MYQPKQLHLRDNLLTHLPHQLTRLTNLKQLDLGMNRFQSIPIDIGSLQNLENLNLSYNQLTSLPESIEYLKNLKNLDISENKLSKLPQFLMNLSQTDIDYNGNPIVDQNRGKVYVLTKKMRGKWADYKSLRGELGQLYLVDVTSSSVKYRDHFSPMKIPNSGDYYGFHCFENFWQSGKVYQDVDRKKQIEWWKNQVKGKRVYPSGKQHRVLYAEWSEINTKRYNYIESRKDIYVPYYHNLIKDDLVLKQLKEKVMQGINIAIVDYDGPKKNDGSPDILEVNLDVLKTKINDPRFPFGHCYVVSSELLGIPIQDYIRDK